VIFRSSHYWVRGLAKCWARRSTSVARKKNYGESVGESRYRKLMCVSGDEFLEEMITEAEMQNRWKEQNFKKFSGTICHRQRKEELKSKDPSLPKMPFGDCYFYWLRCTTVYVSALEKGNALALFCPSAVKKRMYLAWRWAQVSISSSRSFWANNIYRKGKQWGCDSE